VYLVTRPWLRTAMVCVTSITSILRTGRSTAAEMFPLTTQSDFHRSCSPSFFMARITSFA
jgi:hypothetical protein